MAKKEKKGLEIKLDVVTVENITTSYLKETFTQLQSEISRFNKDRVGGSRATVLQWEDYDVWQRDSQSISRMLAGLLDYDDYVAFMEKTYEHFYPIKED